MPSSQPRPAERRFSHTVRAALLGSSLAAAGGTGSLAYGAEAQALDAIAAKPYNIPAGPLGRTLADFAAGAGIALSFEPGLTQGLSSPPLTGTYSAREAVTRLLAGSGLDIVESPGGSYTLVRQPQPDAEELPAVTVTGTEIRESAYGPVEGYRAERTGTATKTDTPIRDTPAAIQVVPKQVIEDQQAIRITDVIQNVSSVRPGSSFGNRADSFIVRGFSSFLSARDGFLSNQLFGDPGFIDLASVERVEVLKGPASVLYGLGDPGGLVNIVTKRPLSEAQYKLRGQAGSYDFYRAEADLSQPFNADGTLALRVNAAYQDWDSFRDFFKHSRRVFVAPVLGWQPSESTKVLVDFEYVDQELPFDRGLVASGKGVANVPISRYFGEDFSTFDLNGYQSRYIIEHQLNSTWMLRHTGRYQESEADRFSADSRGLRADNRTLNRRATDQHDDADQWTLQLDAIGDFTDAAIGHKLLLGVEAGTARKDVRLATASLAAIDIFDPVYGARPGVFGDPTLTDQEIEYIAGYVQDQIWLGERWKLLLGLRYDDTTQTTVTTTNRTTKVENDARRFSPRAGLMYDVTDWASLYASYSKSFKPVAGTTFGGTPFDPETGEQVEAGIKTEFLDGRVGATLAWYELKRQNVTTADPVNTGFSIQTGEQRSRGVELDVTGNIGSGWNLIGSAAYTDAEVTKDNTFTPGNRIQGVPQVSGSLWVTHEIQDGDWKGLGFGAGVFAAGEREGDLANSFQVPGYVRADASLFYRSKHWRATVGLKNLLDKEYIESPVSRNEIYPGVPLTVLGTLEVGF
jgi:iron complex outermembrane receptor protein